jgi:hypothetical protein
VAAPLGNVLWWLGIIIGGGAAALMYFVADGPYHPQNEWMLLSIIAGVPIGIGWACRYVLAGPPRERQTQAWWKNEDAWWNKDPGQGKVLAFFAALWLLAMAYTFHWF